MVQEFVVCRGEKKRRRREKEKVVGYTTRGSLARSSIWLAIVIVNKEGAGSVIDVNW